MTEQPHKTDPQLNWMGFQKAAGDRQGFRQLTKGQRTMLGWGGTLLGLGAGTCLAFAIYIFEKAHPLEVINSQGYTINGYPNMALTVFLVLLGSLVAGFGIAALGAALISTRHGQAMGANDPAPMPERSVSRSPDLGS